MNLLGSFSKVWDSLVTTIWVESWDSDVEENANSGRALLDKHYYIYVSDFVTTVLTLSM